MFSLRPSIAVADSYMAHPDLTQSDRAPFPRDRVRTASNPPSICGGWRTAAFCRPAIGLGLRPRQAEIEEFSAMCRTESTHPGGLHLGEP